MCDVAEKKFCTKKLLNTQKPLDRTAVNAMHPANTTIMSSRGGSGTVPPWKRFGFANADDYCVDLVSAIDMIFFFRDASKIPIVSSTTNLLE